MSVTTAPSSHHVNSLAIAGVAFAVTRARKDDSCLPDSSAGLISSPCQTHDTLR